MRISQAQRYPLIHRKRKICREIQKLRNVFFSHKTDTVNLNYESQHKSSEKSNEFLIS